VAYRDGDSLPPVFSTTERAADAQQPLFRLSNNLHPATVFSNEQPVSRA